MDNEFSSFLKQKRKQRGYTVNQLALYSGISAAQISRIENSRRGVPKPNTIKKLAKGLKLPYEQLMKAAGYIDNDDDTNENDRPAELTEFLKQANVMFHGVPMTEEDKKRIEDVLTILFWDAKKRREKEKGDTNDLDGSRNSRN